MQTFSHLPKLWFEALLRELARAHVGVCVVAFMGLSLILLNVRHASISRDAAIASSEKALLSVAQSVAGHASVAFGLADTIARDIALELETFGTNPERIEKLQKTAVARAAEVLLVSNVVAIDAEGKVIFQLHEAGGTPAQFQTREFFIYHRAHRQRTPFVSHPVRAFSDNRWVVPVSRRFDHADGSFAGVVVALINQGYFDRFHHSLGVGEKETVALYQTDRSRQGGRAPVAIDGATPPLDPRIAEALKRLDPRGPISAIGRIGSDDQDARLYAMAQVYSFGQTAIVTRPLASVLTAWDAANRVAVQSAVMMVGLLAFLVLALFLQVRGRRAVEGAMQRTESQFRLMLDGVADYGIFMLDINGRVVTWNVGAERVTGYAAHDVIGSFGDFFCIPGDRIDGRAARILTHALEYGREENDGWRLRRDGTQFLVHAITTPLYDTHGQHYGYLKVLRDITAARRIEQELQASEFRWKYALQGAGEGVWDIDNLKNEAEVSGAYWHMLGYVNGVSPLSAAAWAALLHPEDLGRTQIAFWDHCKGKTPNYAAEYRIACADGKWKWVLSRGMVVNRDVEGKATRIIGTHTDISQLKEIEEKLHEQNALMQEKNAELKQVSKVKSEFLANMSHELRTPLNAVLGFTGTILMELPGPLNPEQRKQLEIVRDSGRHLLALINELLDLSKIESGSAEVLLVPVRCQSLVADVVRSLMPLATQKHLTLEIVPCPEPVDIVTDARLLKQILINLIGNAVKFTESGSVTVQLRQEPASDTESGTVWIDVQDTGIGIREEDIGKLFMPFTQIEAALSRRFEGTGLGLNVSKRYAKLLGATLHVASRYGQGSRFSVCLPVPQPVLI